MKSRFWTFLLDFCCWVNEEGEKDLSANLLVTPFNQVIGDFFRGHDVHRNIQLQLSSSLIECDNCRDGKDYIGLGPVNVKLRNHTSALCLLFAIHEIRTEE